MNSLNTTYIDTINITAMRMKSMIMGKKLQRWLQTLSNDEKQFFYIDAGILFTQHGHIVNILHHLADAHVGSLQAFAIAISGNLVLYNYFVAIDLLL